MEFKCNDCGREEDYLDTDDAHENGWRKKDGGWLCDNCDDSPIDGDDNDLDYDEDDDDDDFSFGGLGGGFGGGGSGFGGGSFGGGGARG